MKMVQIVYRCPAILCTHNVKCVDSHSEKEHNVILLILMQAAKSNSLVFKRQKVSNKIPPKIHILWHHIQQGRHEA